MRIGAGTAVVGQPGHQQSQVGDTHWPRRHALRRRPRPRTGAADYAPPAFQARALQHTNVQLTWDADDDSRKRALTRKLNAEELKEDDFKVGGGGGGEGGLRLSAHTQTLPQRCSTAGRMRMVDEGAALLGLGRFHARVGRV